MISIDKLCYQSGLRRVNAGEKFSFAVITLLLCAASRHAVPSCVVLLTMGALTVGKGGVPFPRYLKFLALPFSFLVLGTLAILLEIRETPLGLFAFPLGGWYLTASLETLAYTLELVLTALASVSCLYFLSLTTPLPEILEVLRKLHCPKLVVELMLLIYRFIFLLLDTASAITVSQHCRLGNRDYRTSLRSFGMLGAVLLVRSAKRADKLYAAMEARCYDDTIRVLPESRPPKAAAILAICLYDGALLALVIWRSLL